MHSINPYDPPAAGSVRGEPHARRSPWPGRLALFYAATMPVMLGIEAWEHESIVAMGPVVLLIGCVLCIVAYRYGNAAGVVLGASAVGLCLSIVMLINVMHWSPAAGDAPVTVIIWVYALLAAPLACYVFRS